MSYFVSDMNLSHLATAGLEKIESKKPKETSIGNKSWKLQKEQRPEMD